MKCAGCRQYCDDHHFVIGGRELCPKCAIEAEQAQSTVLLQRVGRLEKDLEAERQQWVEVSNELITERERVKAVEAARDEWEHQFGVAEALTKESNERAERLQASHERASKYCEEILDLRAEVERLRGGAG